MERILKIFPSSLELAEEFASDLLHVTETSAKKKRPFNVALSGGSTPEQLFTLLGERYSELISWKYIHLFWGDERCVAPEDTESNFGMTRRKLLDKLRLPYSNVHRIKGENDPEEEAIRYSEEIYLNVPLRDKLPVFDLVMLGVGEDGHTASIFPGIPELLTSEKICETVVQPGTGQKRITVTGRVLNNADSVAFLVTGENKAEIVRQIIKREPSALSLPASNIIPVNGELTWYIDNDAGRLL